MVLRWICYYWRPEKRSHFLNFTLGTLERYLAFLWSYRVESVLKRKLRVCRSKVIVWVDPVGPLLLGQIGPQRCRSGIFFKAQNSRCFLTRFLAEIGTFISLIFQFRKMGHFKLNFSAEKELKMSMFQLKN